MNLRNGALRKGCTYILIVLFALSMCFVATGCDNAGPSPSSTAPEASTSDAGTESSTSDTEAEPAKDPTEVARSETQYALYYANKALSELTYLDDGYAELKDVYDRAARAWYKGQYYMDLVTCGEITKDDEVKQYLDKAMTYFTNATTDAKSVVTSLEP